MESSTPNAVMFSGLTTIGSFSTLALSNHSGTSSMGVLLFLSLSVTLFNCLVVLPFIIKSLEKKITVIPRYLLDFCMQLHPS